MGLLTANEDDRGEDEGEESSEEWMRRSSSRAVRCLWKADEAGKSKSSNEVVTKEASAEIGKEK
ncbi:hypothetical protein Tco_1414536, partial [Tanacetum coccineum]